MKLESTDLKENQILAWKRSYSNIPAGLTSEKKVPTFFPSTMSVITWPVILGFVPFAMTTEVPPCSAQRAALTCKTVTQMLKEFYFLIRKTKTRS